MSGVLKLEAAVLNWIRNKYNDSTLSCQIEALVPSSHEYTVVGSYTHFTFPPSIAKLNTTFFPKRVIDGPYIKSPGIEYDGGSVLFTEDGYITCLEIYANGNKFDENTEEFELFDS